MRAARTIATFLAAISAALSIGIARAEMLVGAWYFTGWSTEAGDKTLLRSRTRAVYNRDDPWGGVRDLADASPTQRFSGSRPLTFADRRPLIGFYDLADRAAFKIHLRQAESAGLSFFALYWYWDADTAGEVYSAGRYLEAAAASSIQLTFTPITLRRAPISQRLWEEHIVPALVGHMQTPQYMRVSGKPLLPYFPQKFAPGYTETQAIDFLRLYHRQKTGSDLNITYVLRGADSDSVPRQIAASLRPNAFACFIYGPLRPAEAYSDSIERWLRRMTAAAASVRHAAFYPCAGTGFDARPWFNIGWGSWGATRRFTAARQRPFDANVTVNDFTKFLARLDGFFRRFPQQSEVVFIYAWNEWGEGGILEPSMTFGYAFLQAVQRTFKLTPRRVPICPVRGVPGCT
jgi:hypothetical protein